MGCAQGVFFTPRRYRREFGRNPYATLKSTLPRGLEETPSILGADQFQLWGRYIEMIDRECGYPFRVWKRKTGLNNQDTNWTLLEINALNGIELVEEAPANPGLGFGHLRLSALSLALFNDNLIAALHADWLGAVLFYNEKLISHVTGFCLGQGI